MLLQRVDAKQLSRPPRAVPHTFKFNVSSLLATSLTLTQLWVITNDLLRHLSTHHAARYRFDGVADGLKESNLLGKISGTKRAQPSDEPLGTYILSNDLQNWRFRFYPPSYYPFRSSTPTLLVYGYVFFTFTLSAKAMGYWWLIHHPHTLWDQKEKIPLSTSDLTTPYRLCHPSVRFSAPTAFLFSD